VFGLVAFVLTKPTHSRSYLCKIVHNIIIRRNNIYHTHTTNKQDLGPIKYFLGSAVAQEKVIIAITQSKLYTYVRKQAGGMVDYQSNNTPMDPNVQFLTKFVKLKSLHIVVELMLT